MAGTISIGASLLGAAVVPSPCGSQVLPRSRAVGAGTPSLAEITPAPSAGHRAESPPLLTQALQTEAKNGHS